MTLKVRTALITLMILMSCGFLLAQQGSLGPIKDGEYYSFKIKGINDGNRYLCYHTKQLVVFFCDSRSSESTWSVNLLKKTGSLGGKNFPFVQFKDAEVNEPQCHGTCFLSSTFKSGFVSLDHHNVRDTLWTIVDSKDGTVLIGFLELSSVDENVVAAVHYLKVDPKSARVGVATDPKQATVWYPEARDAAGPVQFGKLQCA